MRNPIYNKAMKVNGWNSEYQSLQKTLDHYKRMTTSESTKRNIIASIHKLNTFAGIDPDKMVQMKPAQIAKIAQKMLDDMKDKGSSIRYINITRSYILTFLEKNGFKNAKAVEIEGYHQPARYRKVVDYIPSSDEILKIAYASGSKRNIALILCDATSGLRNSTIIALRWKDIKDEYTKGYEIPKIPVYPEMKEIEPNACKGSIPYFSFINKEATSALRAYIQEDRGGMTDDNEFVFCAESNYTGKNVFIHMNDGSFEIMIKRAAKLANIPNWQNVRPKSLRPFFESALRAARLDYKDQEYLMGHILPGVQDTYYDKSKTEYLREQYAKVDFFGSRDVKELKQKGEQRDKKITELEGRLRATQKQMIREVFERVYPEDWGSIQKEYKDKWSPEEQELASEVMEEIGNENRGVKRAEPKRESKILTFSAGDEKPIKQALEQGYEFMPNAPTNGKVWLQKKL